MAVCKMKNTRFHPAVPIVYFISLSCLTAMLFNPWTVLFCILAELLHLALLTDGKRVGRTAVTSFCMIVFFAILNALLNPWGSTPLLYINDRPFTWEALARGGLTGGMLSAMLLLYLVYAEYIDNGKFLSVFGKILPTFSLMLSMTLRFLPYLRKRLAELREIQRNFGISTETGTLRHRMRSGISLYWSVLSRALEDSMDTYAAMRARGYGNAVKKPVKRDLFAFRDMTAISLVLLLTAGVFAHLCMGSYTFDFFPVIKTAGSLRKNLPAYGMYGIFILLPIFLILWETLRWKQFLKSKI